MIDRDAAWVAEAAGGRLLGGGPQERGPERAVIDSRELRPGDLFVGLRGAHVDGGEFAQQALRINRAGKLPLLVDADHGYGNALNVKRTVEELEQMQLRSWIEQAGRLPGWR